MSLRSGLAIASLSLSTLGTLTTDPPRALGDAPGCNNPSHAFSYAGNCGPGAAFKQRCALTSRQGPSTNYFAHAPTPIGSAGVFQARYLQVDNGGTANAGCGGITTTTWILVNLGWTSGSGYF